MRLIKQSIERDGSGFVTLYPEDPEDMVFPPLQCPRLPLTQPPQWSAYNLIRPSDTLRASALRRITTESSTGSSSSHRVHTTLTIRVKSTDFDAQASTLHVSGQIAVENEFTKVGQFHTLDLELHRNFTLEKAEGWDSVSRQIVAEACDSKRGASAWAVVMGEGSASIAMMTGERTVLRQRINVPIPGKKGDGRAHDKAMERFYQTTLETLLRHVDIEEALPILLASPAYTASWFLKFVLAEATRRGDKQLMAQKGNFLVVHSSTGQYHSLGEVLKDPAVVERLKDTRYARETGLMDKFNELMRQDSGKAWYGPREVERAVEAGAVGRGGGVLLISNSLFRSVDVQVRNRWVTLVDKVKEVEGGEVKVLSSEHDSGKRLLALGGIAAILTFPIFDFDDEDVDGGEEEDDSGPTDATH